MEVMKKWTVFLVLSILASSSLCEEQKEVKETAAGMVEVEIPPEISLNPVSRDRKCCKYAHREFREETICHKPESCILLNETRALAPPLDQCSVVHDSKKDKRLSKSECFLQTFDVYDGNKFGSPLPFFLKPYIFSQYSSPQLLPAVELFVSWNYPWKRVRFRIMNMNICDLSSLKLKEDSPCFPRCVLIHRDDPVINEDHDLFLGYDCEVGFFRVKEQLSNTGGNTYRLDICITLRDDEEKCGSYLFQMPFIVESRLAPVSTDESIILMEVIGLEEVILHVSNDTNSSEFDKVSIFYNGSLLTEFPFSSEFTLPPSMEPGTYKVAIRTISDRLIDVVGFTIRPTGSARFVLLIVLLLSVIFGVSSVYLFKRYHWVKMANQVNPQRLVEAGRIQPKEVFIITNVDNRHHIDVVLSFSRYLKAHCAVGKVHFALDPETGITSQADHDPWRWAQEVADKMATSNGYLIFIGAPPSSMGVPIYKDLPNNQTFMTASYLKNMIDENRVAVVEFAYSDPSTIPTLLPSHIRSKVTSLPRQMNDFLCHMLNVKKRELFSCLPISFIQPQVAPYDLNCYAGGAELLDEISRLTSKVEAHRAMEMAAKEVKQPSKSSSPLSFNGNGSIVPNANSSVSPIIKIADKKDSTLEERGSLLSREDKPLQMEIEPNVVSLKDQDTLNRDTRVNVEYT